MSPNPKNGLLERTKIDITFLWEDPEAKLLTPDQLLGYPLKLGKSREMIRQGHDKIENDLGCSASFGFEDVYYQGR